MHPIFGILYLGRPIIVVAYDQCVHQYGMAPSNMTFPGFYLLFFLISVLETYIGSDITQDDMVGRRKN